MALRRNDGRRGTVINRGETSDPIPAVQRPSGAETTRVRPELHFRDLTLVTRAEQEPEVRAASSAAHASWSGRAGETGIWDIDA
jgi:hypothetical protein